MTTLTIPLQDGFVAHKLDFPKELYQASGNLYKDIQDFDGRLVFVGIVNMPTAFSYTPAKTRTATPISYVYSNNSGSDATLTANSSGAIGSINSYTPVLNDIILVDGQSNPIQNGIYTVTNVGSGSTPYVLTRSTEFNSIDDILFYEPIFITNGTYAGTSYTTKWFNKETAVMGTVDISFIMYSGNSSADSYLQGNQPNLYMVLFETPASSIYFDETETMLVNIPDYINTNSQFVTTVIVPSNQTTQQFITGLINKQ